MLYNEQGQATLPKEKEESMNNEQLIKDVIRWIITTKNTEMLDESDIELVYSDYMKEQVGNVAKPNACAQLCEGWRDASKELPPIEHQAYFVYDKEGSMGFAHYLGEGIFGGWPDVIAWMPLPSPPAFV